MSTIINKAIRFLRLALVAVHSRYQCLLRVITQEGLLMQLNEQDTARYARDIYRAYRRQYNVTGGFVGPFRTLRDWLIRIQWPGISSPDKLHARAEDGSR